MFTPPRCPYPICPSQSNGRFVYHRKGVFTRAVDRRVVQRYVCLTCGRGFSDQTFRFDFGLRRPDLSAPIFWALCSKVTHRQTARQLGCARGTVESRLERLAEHCEAFHAVQLERLRGRLSADLALDELETYEAARRRAPLTVPVLLHEATWFVVDVCVAPLPARGRPASWHRPRCGERSEHDEHEHDERDVCEQPRASGSIEAVRQCLERVQALLDPSAVLYLRSDRKASYAPLARSVFGVSLRHVRASSDEPRGLENPLFRIHRTLALLRDGVSRLVHRTWAASKKRERLRRHLWVWVAFRNYVRCMVNRTVDVSCASALGLFAAPLSTEDLLGLLPRFRADPPTLYAAEKLCTTKQAKAGSGDVQLGQGRVRRPCRARARARPPRAAVAPARAVP